MISKASVSIPEEPERLQHCPLKPPRPGLSRIKLFTDTAHDFVERGLIRNLSIHVRPNVDVT